MTTCCPASNKATAKRKHGRQPGSKNKPKIPVPTACRTYSKSTLAVTSQKPSRPLLVPVAFSESASSSKSATPPTPQRSTPWSPPIARFPPFSSSLTSPPVPSTAADFTNFLHSRFLSKPDLAAYTVHPSHLVVVHQNAPIIEDIFAVDWITDLDSEIVPSPGSAMRFLIAKPRKGKQAAEIVKGIDEVRASNLC
ncbi:hypothetical protein MA16_Dca028880 [Dendrobium catenatum]|uniref:Stress-response A/B barrel domain-containing protein n=1 Tax=Dendrobium catenatum TaxID=906689 RepID=A0A2I0VBH5_9ASPA|nr:hypothetical protein MA16_Dca028880 [Dendrobium catenatum]